MREKGTTPSQSQHARLSRPFEIRTRQDDDVTTIAISGNWTSHLSISSETRSAPPRKAVDDRSSWICRTSFMDSTGLSALLAARKRASENNHQLRFLPSRHDQVTGSVDHRDKRAHFLGPGVEGAPFLT